MGDERRPAPGDTRTASALVVGSVTVLAAVLVAAVPPATNGDPRVDVATRLFLVVVAALGVTVIRSRLSSTAKGWLVAFLVGAGLVVGAALILNANGFGPLGTQLDESFRTAAITKFAAHWGLPDFAYRGLPAWYPPLSFWLLGRAAALLHVAPWQMVKVGLLASAFLVPVLTWPLWSRVTGRVAGVGAVVAGALLFQNWYEWYSWLALAVFVPWWLWAVLGVGPRPPRSRPALLVAALIGAALVATFYYYLFIGLTQLVLLAALRPAAARRGVDLGPRSGRRAAIVLGGAALLSAVYWLPLLVSMVARGAQTLSARFYGPGVVDLDFRFFTFDLVGVLLLVGLVYLLVTALRSPVSMALLTLLAAAYAWSVLGYVFVLLNAPVLSYRANDVIESVLAVGAGLAVIDVWRATSSSEAIRARLGRTGHRLATVVVGGVLVIALGQLAVEAIPYVTQQRAARVPTQLLTDFDHATRGQAIGRVVLTDIIDIPVYRDVDVFNVWNAHYADPPARFTDRIRFLARLSNDLNPTAFAAALAHNTYDTISFVALRPASGNFNYDYGADNFPNGSLTRQISFPAPLFGDALFQEHRTNTVIVFTLRRAHDPLRTLEPCARRPSLTVCGALADLARRYPGDLDSSLTSLIARWQQAQRAG